MAPAVMATLKIAGEIGSTVAKWTNIPEGFAKCWDTICASREPREFCLKCNDFYSFRGYDSHAAQHRKNMEAREEDEERTMKCAYVKCMQQIRISKYAQHIKEHREADEAHELAIRIQQDKEAKLRASQIQQAKGPTKSNKTRKGISRGWCKIE